MTLDEFFDVYDTIEFTAKPLSLDPSKKYIRDVNGRCPVCAVANKLAGTPDTLSAFTVAERIGLDAQDVMDIVTAADGFTSGRASTRERLLSRCK